MQGEARAPERRPERPWGVQEGRLSLTSASVNEQLCCACVGRCRLDWWLPGGAQASQARFNSRPSVRWCARSTRGCPRGPERIAGGRRRRQFRRSYSVRILYILVLIIINIIYIIFAITINIIIIVIFISSINVNVNIIIIIFTS